MVRQPAAEEAAAYGRAHPRLSLGLHIDFGEWMYRDGEWVVLYQRVEQDDAHAVADELERQLTRFRRMMGHGPTHLDSHQHVHQQEPLRAIVRALAATLCVPLRWYTPRVRTCGDFYGQTGKGESYRELISVEALLRILGAIVPGVTELICHPGEGALGTTMYDAERTQETATLCNPQIREAVTGLGIRLLSFGDLAR
jgi:predicted glycoside hydrolase/deacetylase ChbG (UPF0249 family)